MHRHIYINVYTYMFILNIYMYMYKLYIYIYIWRHTESGDLNIYSHDMRGHMGRIGLQN